jgi:hypothetical protein
MTKEDLISRKGNSVVDCLKKDIIGYNGSEVNLTTTMAERGIGRSER